jgi:hypothetical protein
MCQLDSQEEKRWLAMTQAMINYLSERNDWNPSEYDSVNWNVFSTARNTSVSPQFVPKFCRCHLPVGEKAHQNASKYPPQCPTCGSPSETNDHFILCYAPSRLLWRTKFLRALDKERRRLYTDPTLIQFMKIVFTCTFNRSVVEPISAFSAIVKTQSFWSNSWLVAHQALILLRPGRTPTTQAKQLKKSGSVPPEHGKLCHAPGSPTVDSLEQ